MPSSEFLATAAGLGKSTGVPQKHSKPADRMGLQELDAYLGSKERARAALTSIIPALIGLPFIISWWMPTTAVVIWTVLYGTCSFVGVVAVLRGGDDRLPIWTASAGALFGFLPISAIIWEREASFWIATAIVALYIASEVSALPLVQDREWRGGIVLVSLGTVVAATQALPLFIALLMIPVFGNVLVSSDAMRKLRDTLERERGIAHAETVLAREMASRDHLTGMLNRRGLASHMESLDGEPWSMLMVDANRFKLVNDTHGYAAGDQVLAQLASALRLRLPAGWVIGRQGGDEFVAIATGRVAVPSEVSDPIDCDLSLHGVQNRISVNLSAGVTFSDGTISPDRMLSQAGYALQASKRQGVALSRFGGVLQQRFDQMIAVSAGVASSSEIEPLEAHAQMVTDMNGRIVGFELLARWQRSDGTLVAPLDFLPLLTEGGLMPVFNDAMLEKGVAFAARFNNRPDAPFVAVNIGASSLTSPALVDRISELLNDYRVDAARLMIEVTETEVPGDSKVWEATARKIEALGVKLAIDDFGAGYSSIERINQMPISHLKFDRSLTTSTTGPLGEIIRGVVGFAERAGIGIIAEGIETLDELEAMTSIGVRHFQGWWFGHPGPLDDAEKAVIDQRSDIDWSTPVN